MSVQAKRINMYSVPLNASKIKDVEENKHTGFIRVYRSLQNKGWYKKSEYVHLWVHLFISATRTPFESWFDGKPVLLTPGQLITGRKKLSSETGIQESKVERILKCFQNDHQIEQQSSSTSRLISINNWHIYQYVEQQDEQQANNGRTTGEQRVNTIQESREYKEVEEEREGQKKLTPTQFYKSEIEANKEHELIEKYKALVEYLKGKNDEDITFKNVLALEQQLTFKQYLRLREKWAKENVDLRDILKAMENDKKAIKDKCSLYLTLNGWANIRQERSSSKSKR